MTITGAGAATTIIDGNSIDRVLHTGPANNAITVNISGVTIREGNTNLSGGGIQNQGILTLTSTTLTANVARNGGGLQNSGVVGTTTATLNNVTVSGNQTTVDDGGGVSNNLGTLTVNDSLVENNTAGDEGGGFFDQGSFG